MSYQEILEKAKRLPLYDQLRLIEELARVMQEQASPSAEAVEAGQAKDARDLPVPLAGTFPLTDEWLNSAKNEGRT